MCLPPTSPRHKKLLPPQTRFLFRSLTRGIRFYRIYRKQIYQEKKDKERTKEKILSFSGSWKDMKEQDFQEFLDDIPKRRSALSS
jgi:hypothetical protein